MFNVAKTVLTVQSLSALRNQLITNGNDGWHYQLVKLNPVNKDFAFDFWKQILIANYHGKPSP